MKTLLSVNLAFSALLATCMLQMGDEQTSVFICVVAFFAILSGLLLVDVRGLFALSDGMANVFILIVVAVHLGVLLRSPTEFLAYSIANILAYVQMVLFFKSKETRVCFQLMTLSFLQVCVACVSEQGLVFACLLLVYCFSILCVLTLLVLVKEKEYYDRHAFMRSALGTTAANGGNAVKGLFSLAVRTFFLTPVYILFGAQEDEYEVFLRQEDPRSMPKFHFKKLAQIVRLLFRDPKRAMTEIGEAIAASRKEVAARKPLPAYTDAHGDRLFGFWEQAQNDASPLGDYRDEQNGANGAANGGTNGEKSRFPLLYSSPVFSGANTPDKIVLSTGLVRLLLTNALIALIFGLVIFFLFPRFQRLEWGNIQFGHDGWNSAPERAIASVGFNEKVQLGDLGPSRDNYAIVLNLKFSDPYKKDAPAPILEGTPLYLRGVTLIEYANRQWSRYPKDFNEFGSTPNGNDSLYGALESRHNPSLAAFDSPYCRLDCKIQNKSDQFHFAQFDAANNLVHESVNIVPFSSQVVFSVWPFCRIDGYGHGAFLDDTWLVRTRRDCWRYCDFELLVDAFRDSRQIDLVPNQENIEPLVRPMLEIDEKLLPGLCKTARQWDAESGLAKTDVIGRAKHLESQLRDGDRFSYARGRVTRRRDLDPLEDFITNQPSGHCEYFAGALAMMLRAVGIPSRIVIGFRPTAGSPDDDVRTVVRQSDAHSWVEAYIPRDSLTVPKNGGVLFPSQESLASEWWKHGAWLRLDATPSQDAAMFSGLAKNYHVWVANCQSIWNTYILNFNDGRQQNAVYKPAMAVLSAIATAVSNRDFWRDCFGNFIPRTIAFVRNLLAGNWDSVAFAEILIPTTVLVLFALLGFILCRRFLRRKRAVKNATAAMKSSAWFYARLEAYFNRLGLARLSSETPKEYILRCTDDRRFIDRLRNDWATAATANDLPAPDSKGNRDQIVAALESSRLRLAAFAMEIVDACYRVRYGGKTLSENEKSRIKTILTVMESGINAEGALKGRERIDRA